MTLATLDAGMAPDACPLALVITPDDITVTEPWSSQ